jgi:hypothetical protein
VPRVVDYAEVFDTAQALGLKSLYHNSGAFGFAADVPVQHVGWVGPPDPTIRPAALELARHVPPPYEPNLAMLATRAWRDYLPGPVWVLPKSHWAFELDFGSATWMPTALREAGIDPAVLTPRNDGAAVEFLPVEETAFARYVERLLTNLSASDFALLFPAHALTCSLHHHKQIWWTTPEATLHGQLEQLVADFAQP